MDSSYSIHQIMQRYDLRDNLNVQFTFEELKSININVDFIFSLLKVFEHFPDFPEKELNAYPAEVIIDYIRRTHKFYLSKKLPEIEQSVHLLMHNYSEQHPLLGILENFYSTYKNDLGRHILAEENHLLPYISRLQEAERNGISEAAFFALTEKYSISNFMAHHHDTEDDLQKVRKTILNYQPPVTNQSVYRILISQLQVFEKDLSVHTLIEDKILIPKAYYMEGRLKDRFMERVKLN